MWTREESEKRVRLGVLVMGKQDGYEHVRKVASRNYVFTSEDQIVNFDDVIPYEELNDLKHRSRFLTGEDEHSLHIVVVATPLSRLSTLDGP